MVLKGLITFAAVAVADAAWTKYLLAANERRAVGAGVWSAVIVALSVVTVTSYVHDWRLAPFAIAGAFAGTWFTVRRAK